MTVWTVPVVEDLQSGGLDPALHLNAWARAWEFLCDVPRWTVHQQTTATSLSTGVFTAIGFDAQLEISSHGGHSTTTNNTRYTVSVAGIYELSGKISFDSNTTGRRNTMWTVNGSSVTGSEIVMPPSSSYPMVPLAHIRLRLSPGDYVQALGHQDSGGTILTKVGAYTTVGSYMSGHWVSR